MPINPADRYTKIICTLGPASSKEEMIAKMAERGMNIARINCSHGSRKGHHGRIEMVRAINEKKGYRVGVLLDLEGYRMRIGKLSKNMLLQAKDIVYLSNTETEESIIPLDFQDDLKIVQRGANIFIDDGHIHLRVLEVSGKKIKARVLQGGVLKERKGVNIPGLKLQPNILTEKDAEDIEFGIDHHVDMLAQSFVRNKKDIQRVYDKVKPMLPDCTIIAKIENEEGVKNIDSILDACDGVMVARGDLGVTMPIYKIPVIQKYLTHHANRRKKMSIIATEMLDSMIEKGQPTRAEVTDVANAILDGADYIMLSGETAIGKYPSRSIKMMSQIVAYTENYANARPK